MVLPDDRQHVHPGRGTGPEDFDDLPLRIDVARFPRFETDDDFIAAARRLRERRLRRNLDVNVVDDARIIRNDVEEVLRLLQSSDERIVRAFEDANHPALSAIPTAFRARVTFIAGDPRHHFVAVHRRAGIFGRDEKILLSRLLPRKKCVARLVNMQCARNEIRFRGQDVAVFPDAGDFPGLLELPQHLVQSHANATFPAESFSQLKLIERPIFRRAQQPEDLFAKLILF